MEPQVQLTVKQELVTQLESLINTHDFGKMSDAAYSLVSQYIKKGQHDGSLSEKQWKFVNSLVTQATKPAVFSTDAATPVGDFSGVIDLFLVAKKHLKYPKVSLVTVDGEIVQLSMAGDRSKFPGTINVTDGGSYGQNTWYGRVNTAGDFQNTSAATSEVIGLLKQLADNPHLAASFHGKQTNVCCFCSKYLTFVNSVTVGYGEICAGHWGLHSEWKEAAK